MPKLRDPHFYEILILRRLFPTKLPNIAEIPAHVEEIFTAFSPLRKPYPPSITHAAYRPTTPRHRQLPSQKFSEASDY